MADVFVSYKSEDRERVRPIVAALEAAHLSVWWDAQIAGGSAWRQEIQEALDAARCVIVVWSRRSVGRDGQFVHDEAVRAQRRRVYLPICIDAVDPPLGFGEVQVHSLIGWKGKIDDSAMAGLIAAAQAMVAGDRRPSAPIRPPTRYDRRLVIGSVVAAAAATAGGSYALWQQSGAGSVGNSIAVLPFANLSGDAGQAYFADGMAEELRAALTQIAQLKVIGRTSSELMRDADAIVAARKLGVANILIGSVRRSAATIRVSAQLIDGTNGVERWSESYDRAPGDAIEIQSDIAEAIADQLRIRLSLPNSAAFSLGGTRNAEAHDLYLKARALLTASRSEASSNKAVRMLDAAIALDPGYAQALSSRSFWLADHAQSFARAPADWKTGFKDAETSARTAIMAAPKFVRGYLALGHVLFLQLDMAGASAQYDRGFSLNSGDTKTLADYAVFSSFMGRDDKAVALIKAAIALDPLNDDTIASLSWIDFIGRRYSSTISLLKEDLSLDESELAGLAVSLYLAGRPREALDTCAKASSEQIDCQGLRAMIAGRRGDTSESDSVITKIRTDGGDAIHWRIARIYAQRGDRESALAELEKAWQFRDPGLSWLRIDAFLDPLRGDPRFKVIEARLNFP